MTGIREAFMPSIARNASVSASSVGSLSRQSSPYKAGIKQRNPRWTPAFSLVSAFMLTDSGMNDGFASLVSGAFCFAIVVKGNLRDHQ
jgi:hypothetical protein